MKRFDFFIIIYTIIILLSVMYATQPLQPLLSKEFGVSIFQSSLFTAVILMFLAIAPIFYGYILEHINAKKMLVVTSIILSITNIFLGFSTSYEMFLFLRVVEAIVIPAILTACMGILASDKKHTKRNMSFYVASTVFGGLVGRVFSGFIATEFGWRYVFFALSISLIIGLYFLFRLRYAGEAKLIKPKITDAIGILKDRRFFVIYSLMFGVFFVFAGVLNVIPFQIKEQFHTVSETHIGLLYLGYGIGIVVSLSINKIVKIFKKEYRVIIFGLYVLFISVLLFLNKNIWSIFIVVFVLCFGMFVIHTISARLANSLKESKKSLTSGMYLTFYYLGGAFGSLLPSVIYDMYGWDITIYTLMFVLVTIILFIHYSSRYFKEYS